MTAGFQSPAEIGMIVDLSVIGDVDTVILRGHGLMTAGDVDDAEPPVT
jgi:hypothetical protein